jgi:hypothetical protein
MAGDFCTGLFVFPESRTIHRASIRKLRLSTSRLSKTPNKKVFARTARRSSQKMSSKYCATHLPFQLSVSLPPAPPSTSSKSAQSSAPPSPSLSASEDESSVHSAEGGAEYEPDEEVLSGRHLSYSRKRKVPAVSPPGCESDDADCGSQTIAAPRFERQQGRRPRKRRRTLRQIKRYGTWRNWHELG